MVRSATSYKQPFSDAQIFYKSRATVRENGLESILTTDSDSAILEPLPGILFPS